MKDQVLSISQMRHLRDLGVDTSKASMCWLREPNDSTRCEVFIHDDDCYEMSCLDPVPTFTLQDLLNIIPPRVFSRSNEVFSLRIERYIDEWGVYYGTTEDSNGSKLSTPIYGDTLLEAVYEMLCYLAENNLFENKHRGKY